MKSRHSAGSRLKYKSTERQQVHRGAVIRRLSEREIDEWRARLERIMNGDRRPYYGTV